jgi:hypothetical protein
MVLFLCKQIVYDSECGTIPDCMSQYQPELIKACIRTGMNVSKDWLHVPRNWFNSWGHNTIRFDFNDAMCMLPLLS